MVICMMSKLNTTLLNVAEVLFLFLPSSLSLSIYLSISLTFLFARLSRASRSSETAYNLHSQVDRRDHCRIASLPSVSSTGYKRNAFAFITFCVRASGTVLCGKTLRR